MAIVARIRFFGTHRSTPNGYGVTIHSSFTSGIAYQEVADARCWRCGKKSGDLVSLTIDSSDTVDPSTVYHYECVPPVIWHKVAGSLPARPSQSAVSPTSAR